MPAKKKTETELLKETKLKQQVLDARLIKGLTFEAIAKKLKLHDRMAAKRLFDSTLTELIEEQTHQDYETWRAAEIHFWQGFVAEAMSGWFASKGKKSETTSVTKQVVYKEGDGEDVIELPATEVKTTVKTWRDAGDAKMLGAARDGKAELYNLLGLKGLQAQQAEGQASGQPTELVVRQHVYMPGYGEFTPEALEQFWRDLEAKFDDDSAG